MDINNKWKPREIGLLNLADIEPEHGIYILPHGCIEPNGVPYEFYRIDELKGMTKEDIAKAQERVNALYDEMYSPFDEYDYFI